MYAFIFRNTSKVQCSCKFRWFHRKNHIKIYQTTTSLYSNKHLKLIKNIFLPVKKWEIQIIVYIIMLTRFSKRIFNPMRYTGILRWTWNVLKLSYFYEKFRVVSGNMRNYLLNWTFWWWYFFTFFIHFFWFEINFM